MLVVLFYVLGIVSTFNALLTARTSQGAIAWAIGLVSFPYVALPLYWIFGRSKFQGYVDARRVGDEMLHNVTADLERLPEDIVAFPAKDNAEALALERLAHMPFGRHNRARILVDGEATFGAIFEGIAGARDYVLVQFFIVKDDELGRELKHHLLAKAAEGVRVYFLYDEVGSHSLPRSYAGELRAAGVDIRPFKTTKGRGNRLQINFRNHRKIVVVDGTRAYVGGLNVGDEYMGRGAKFGAWRDTHAAYEGPTVLGIQLTFLEDWYWASQEVPKLNWTPVKADGADQRVLAIPTGPADEGETCSLLFLHAINAARERVWIVSPYFVPDLDMVSALHLAALRGVDVRIMLPDKPDHVLVYLASFTYLADLAGSGVRFFRYRAGFLHQKVLLVDDRWAVVGTANADNRSFRLNFEISMAGYDARFAKDVEIMLENDFGQCYEVGAEDYHERNLPFRVACKAARLLSPIL
jgi:cardiolipin synthase